MEANASSCGDPRGVSSSVPKLNSFFPEKVVQDAIGEALRNLGYDRPTEHQARALFEFVSGKDVLVLLPTGSGKSVCFVALPLVFDILKRHATNYSGSNSVVLVVSPLTALMKDQVRKYSCTLPSAFIGEE